MVALKRLGLSRLPGRFGSDAEGGFGLEKLETAVRLMSIRGTGEARATRSRHHHDARTGERTICGERDEAPGLHGGDAPAGFAPRGGCCIWTRTTRRPARVSRGKRGRRHHRLRRH